MADRALTLQTVQLLPQSLAEWKPLKTQLEDLKISVGALQQQVAQLKSHPMLIKEPLIHTTLMSLSGKLACGKSEPPQPSLLGMPPPEVLPGQFGHRVDTTNRGPAYGSVRTVMPTPVTRTATEFKPSSSSPRFTHDDSRTITPMNHVLKLDFPCFDGVCPYLFRGRASAGHTLDDSVTQSKGFAHCFCIGSTAREQPRQNPLPA